jgi:hypothetical protein
MLLGFAWALSPTAVAVAKTQPVVLDGSGMQGGLVQGPDGTVYGATQGGGRTPCEAQWGAPRRAVSWLRHNFPHTTDKS